MPQVRKASIRRDRLPELRKFVETSGPEGLEGITDGMRELIQREMPDLAHRLPPKPSHLKKRPAQ